MGDALHPYWLVGIAAILAVVPLFVGVATAYVKVNVVIGMLRSGLGTQEAPSAMVAMVLSLAITLVIMGGVIDETSKIAEKTDFANFLTRPSVSSIKNLAPLLEPWREFLKIHTGERELSVLSVTEETEASEVPQTDPSLRILLAAFVLTELREAFTMAFMLLLPFLVIDLVVANILVGLGMFMVSPVMIALPLKVVLFVLADGWLLLARSLIASYSG